MKQLWYFITITLLVFTAPVVTWAALGENAASVQADQAQMRATLRPATSTANYTVHESQTPAGVTVKEYVSTTGMVFAVTWTGPTMPDLQQLLGQYFNAYVTAAKSKSGGHKHLTISQPGLVVESQGHMRSFFGKAYLPSQLPAGVTAQELQ